jgi:hypothetical protein
MTNPVLFDIFNDKLEEFFKDLIQAYPEIKEFRKFKSALVMMRNVNSKTPNEIFRNYLLSKYKTAILKKDESVFLEETEYVIYAQDDSKEHWLEFISMLKQIWKTLDETNKAVIWKYFHVLTVLSDKCA